jgi:hypothetical protein
MGTSNFPSFQSCCNRNETSGNNNNIENEKNGNEQNENKLGYNTHQKIIELKEYRFFINNLCSLMMVNNSVETKEFFFIKKAWIRSWYKYTCYEKIRPVLMKYQINNEIDFHKIIMDHKKELNFEGFIERQKPDPIQFFEINNINTNIKENFYIFDSKILKKFIEIYDIDINNNDSKDAFSLKGEIGKGRIIFDVKEYILIMVLNKNWEIKQLMIIFGKQDEHNQFLKNIYGRALSYISKELKKNVQKKKMINYLKDEIFVYDDREFIKYEYLNNSSNFKNLNECNNKKIEENKDNEHDKKTNQDENKNEIQKMDKNNDNNSNNINQVV